MSSESLLLTKTKQGGVLYKEGSFGFHSQECGSAIGQNAAESTTVGDEGFWRHTCIAQWGRRRVLDPLIVILSRGLEPKLLSFSTALGVTLGVFPVCGLTAGLCAIAAVLLRSNCHWPTLILANFIVTPFQLGLVVPFMRVGELVTNGHHFPFTLKGIWDALRGHASRDVLFGVLHAVIGWSIFAPVSFFLLFVIFFPVFRCLLSRFGPCATTIITQ